MQFFRTLVVEADQSARDQLLQALAAMRISAMPAADPVEAESLVAAAPYDLVFVAYEVAGGGLALAARLKQISEQNAQDLASVLITTVDGPALRLAAAQIGIHRILQRPISVRDVAQALDGIISEHGVVPAQGRG